MKEKRKLLLNEHLNVGLLASEIFILVESKPTLLCLHWGLWVISQPIKCKLKSSDLVTRVARASGSLRVFTLSSPFKKFCQIILPFTKVGQVFPLVQSVHSLDQKWMKSKGQPQLLMREQKRWGKSGKKSNRRGQKLYSKYTICMYFSEVKLKSNGSNIRNNVWLSKSKWNTQNQWRICDE